MTRQFTKFLSLDKVELVFTPDALESTARLALERKTGARALRTIVEEALLEVMYDIPERTDVKKVVITRRDDRPRQAADARHGERGRGAAAPRSGLAADPQRGARGGIGLAGLRLHRSSPRRTPRPAEGRPPAAGR